MMIMAKDWERDRANLVWYLGVTWFLCGSTFGILLSWLLHFFASLPNGVVS